MKEEIKGIKENQKTMSDKLDYLAKQRRIDSINIAKILEAQVGEYRVG